MKESLKRNILIVFIVISLFPALLLISWPSIMTASSMSLWLADTLGYVGIVLLLWMYVLGAKSIAGLVFQDIAPVLKIHKWLGKYGVFAVILHPLLVVFSFGESLLYPLLPHIGTLYERHVTLGRISFWLVIVTWLVSAYMRDRVKFRPWKYLHYLAYISVPFALLHIPNVGSHYMSSDAVKIYFFVLVVVYFVITALRLRGVFNLDKTLYTVTSHTQVTDADYVLGLKPVTAIHITPKRGQYTYVKIGYVSEDHPFSVLRYDEATHSLAVGYRVFGDYTRTMSQLSVGASVYVDGPYGSFMQEYPSDTRPVVFLAGGIGITPFVDTIIQNNGQREQWLFATNRSRSSAVLTDEVAPHLGKHFVNVFENGDESLSEQEETGYISADLIRKYLGDDFSRYCFYICGSPAMMKSMKTLLISAGVSKDFIYSEKFGW